MQEEITEKQAIMKIEKTSKIENILIQFCYFIGICITIGLGIAAFIITFYFAGLYFQYWEFMSIRIDNFLTNGLGVIIFLVVVYLVKKLLKHISSEMLCVFTVVAMMVLSAIFIYWAKIIPKADQEMMTYLASEFIKGNYDSLEPGGYLHWYPFQLGYIYLTEILFRLLGENVMIMQMVNVLCIGGIVQLLYNFTKKMFQNQEVNKIFCILMLGFLPIIFFSTFIYGNIIGLLFALIAVYQICLYREQRKIKYLIIASISIGISVLLKKNYQIFFVGMVILWILDFIEKRDKKIFIGIVLSALCMVLFSKLVYFYTEQRTGIEVADGIPMVSYLQMGLRKGDGYKMAGWYDGSTLKIYQEANEDTEEASKQSIEVLKELLQEYANNPLEAVDILIEKIETTWLEPTFQTIWVNEPAENFEKAPESMKSNKVLISFFDGKLSTVYLEYNNIYQIVLYIMAGIGLIVEFKKPTIEKVSLILMVIGGFIFHLFWETKVYYVLTFYILLLPYAANGLQFTFEKIRKQCYNLSKRKKKKIQGGYESKNGNNKSTMEQI